MKESAVPNFKSDILTLSLHKEIPPIKESAAPIEWGSLLSAMCLVAGTCVGGGMLALPVATGVSGFIPSTFMMLLCWVGMTLSALLLLEVHLWMKEGAHIISMASTFLGPIGKGVSWVLYLFICYASIVAYTAAGGTLVEKGILSFTGWEPSKEMGCLLFMIVFGGALFLGHRFIGRVNTLLFIAMIVAYLALVSGGVFEANLSLLRHRYWPTSFLAIPLLLTTFSFQTMLPSLTPYLKRNVKALRWAIIGGTTLTLIIYLIWQWMVLGVVPVSGPSSLIKALEAGEPITQFLYAHLQNRWISILAEYFAFFALTTSFLGIAFGLFDFLSDGLKITPKGKGKWALNLLIVLPTFIFAAYFEKIFLLALDTSGGFGDSILNGIIPALMVWVGRYVYRFPAQNRTPGGKPLVLAVLAFFTCTLLLETLVHTGQICSLFDVCRTLVKEGGL